MDSLEGDPESPSSLHRYLYASANPVNVKDPSGNQDEIEEVGSLGISDSLQSIPVVSETQVLYGVRSALVVAAGLASQVLSDPNIIEEVEGTGLEGVQVVQQSFLQTETILSEAEAEATSIAETGSQARQVLNQLFTRVSTPNPGGIEYHHIVEQGGANASRFGQALQSFGNIIPLQEEVHDVISGFYSSAPEWLPNGTRVRDWMAAQDWETQWSAGLQILKEAVLTGRITWQP